MPKSQKRDPRKVPKTSPRHPQNTPKKRPGEPRDSPKGGPRQPRKRLNKGLQEFQERPKTALRKPRGFETKEERCISLADFRTGSAFQRTPTNQDRAFRRTLGSKNIPGYCWLRLLLGATRLPPLLLLRVYILRADSFTFRYESATPWRAGSLNERPFAQLPYLLCLGDFHNEAARG